MNITEKIARSSESLGRLRGISSIEKKYNEDLSVKTVQSIICRFLKNGGVMKAKIICHDGVEYVREIKKEEEHLVRVINDELVIDFSTKTMKNIEAKWSLNTICPECGTELDLFNIDEFLHNYQKNDAGEYVINKNKDIAVICSVCNWRFLVELVY